MFSKSCLSSFLNIKTPSEICSQGLYSLFQKSAMTFLCKFLWDIKCLARSEFEKRKLLRGSVYKISNLQTVLYWQLEDPSIYLKLFNGIFKGALILLLLQFTSPSHFYAIRSLHKCLSLTKTN